MSVAHSVLAQPAPARSAPQRNYLNQRYGIKSWLLTQDHKRIAILYFIGVTFFFIVGGLLAFFLRLELLTPASDLMALDTYNKVFTMHGIVMVFFVLIPAVPAVLGNFLIPLMVGARDLAFPRINLLSWYCYVIAAFCFSTPSSRAASTPAGPSPLRSAAASSTPTSSPPDSPHSSQAFPPSLPASTSSSPSIACVRPD